MTYGRCGEWGGCDRHDVQLATFDDVQQVLQRGAIGGDGVHVERQMMPARAGCLAGVWPVVDAGAERVEIEHGAIIALGMYATGFQHVIDI